VSINLPSSIKEIGDNTFYGCKSLKSVNIPDSVERIGNGAFCSCINLVSINLPSSIKVIGHNTFYGCKSLKSINIPDSVERIGCAAFYECINLVSINLPSSIKEIGSRTFYGCNSLTSITLPSNIDHKDSSTFKGCESLREIKVYTNDQGSQTERKVDSLALLHFYLIFGYLHNICHLMDTDKSNLEICDPIYNMYPFLLAACTPQKKDICNDKNYDEKKHLEIVFVLLCEAPSVIRQLVTAS